MATRHQTGKETLSEEKNGKKKKSKSKTVENVEQNQGRRLNKKKETEQLD